MIDITQIVEQAKQREYFFDKLTKEWTKWIERGDHAVAIYVASDGQIGWGLYGPEDRYGFFSLLSSGQARSLQGAERRAKQELTRRTS